MFAVFIQNRYIGAHPEIIVDKTIFMKQTQLLLSANLSVAGFQKD